MFRAWHLMAFASLALAACSKSDSDPQVFLPHVVGQNGEDLDAARSKACDPSKVDLTNNILTQQNFQAMFACANYDHSLNGLDPLFNSAEFPQLLTSINSIMKSNNTQSIRDTLGDWLKDDATGTSKIDRLLPFVASLIKNPSFQDFLPVLNNMLQSGQGIWKDLLPGLSEVVYTELFPDNLENAFVVFNSFSSDSGSRGKDDPNHDYATSVKDLARFLKMNVDGKTASAQALELADGIRDLKPDGSSFYELIDEALIRNAINIYFLDSSTIRGEKIDEKLNDSPDDPSVACPNLNDTPEQREECSNRRMFIRGADGSDAPITQLAGLVLELEKDHPDMLPALAAWFSANGQRVSHGLSDYVVRAQVVTNLTKLNVGNYLQQFALKNGMDPNAQITNAQLADLLAKGFTSPDFPDWVTKTIPAINKEAFGPKNAGLMNNTELPADIAALYSAPEVAAFAKQVIPDGQTAVLTSAVKKFNNKHRTDALKIKFTYNGKEATQSVEKHLGDFWVNVVKNTLGEDVVLNYVISLAQTLLTQMANDFRDKNQPIAEWYFNTPYSNPATTEMIVGYAIKELDLLSKYYQNKDWLMGEFTDEAFASDEHADDDKRAFRLLLSQVPNIVLYVRSGESRSGNDLTRAFANDPSGYLVKTEVNLIGKAYSTGWLRKAVRLIEAYHASPTYKRRPFSPPSDDPVDVEKYKLGVNALERIVESLITPDHAGDFSSTTLSRLMVPVSSIVSTGRRLETEHFLLTSADQLLALTDQQINDFMHNLHTAKPPGEADSRRAAYKSVADIMKNKDCPDLVKNVSGLFQENAVKPALDFLARKIDDGSLPSVLRFIRRLLGFGN